MGPLDSSCRGRQTMSDCHLEVVAFEVGGRSELAAFLGSSRECELLELTLDATGEPAAHEDVEDAR